MKNKVLILLLFVFSLSFFSNAGINNCCEKKSTCSQINEGSKESTNSSQKESKGDFNLPSFGSFILIN